MKLSAMKLGQSSQVTCKKVVANIPHTYDRLAKEIWIETDSVSKPLVAPFKGRELKADISDDGQSIIINLR